MVLLNFYLQTFTLLEDLSQNVFNKLISTCDQRLFKFNALQVRVKFKKIDFSFDFCFIVKGFAQWWLEHVARVGRALVLKKFQREITASILVRFFEIPTEVFDDQSLPDFEQYVQVAFV